MIGGGKIHVLLRTAGLVAVLVLLQELVAGAILRSMYNWPSIPLLILVNFGIVVGWYYFKDPSKRLPMFAILIAAFCLSIWIRVVLIYTGLFRFIVPPVIAFVERQLSIIAAIIATPQFLPTAVAACILLLLLPKVKTVYRSIISNGRF